MGYTHGIQWNDEMIEEKIKEVINELNIDYFPSHSEIESVLKNKSLTNKLCDKGSYFWAAKMGLPLKNSETKLGNEYELFAISDIFENTELQSIPTSSRHPYDILTDYRVKIDVKISKPYTNKRNITAYSFNLEKSMPTCDIFLFYCVGNDNAIKKTLIVPANILFGQTQVGVGENSKWDRYKDRWDFIIKTSEFFKTLN